jgi:N6-adenosine-specific RNA methylase IME4
MDNFKWNKYHIVSADPPWPQNPRSTIGKDGKPTKFGGGAQDHYDVDILSTEDIVNLPVEKICEKNCVLFLWTTLPKLEDGLRVLNAWGFKYKTMAFIWVKLNSKNKKLGGLIQVLVDCLVNKRDPNSALMKLFMAAIFFGPGTYFKANVEICLLGTRGKVGKLRKDDNGNVLFFDPKERISVQSNAHTQLIISPIEKHSKKPCIHRDKIIDVFGDISRVELFARKYPSCEGWDLIGNEIDERDIRDVLKDKINECPLD